MNIFSILKERLCILDVLSKYVTVKKAGHYYKGCCPFHHEKTASFTISPDKGIFYCFGCHASGDVISFVSQIEQCTQLDAAKLLAEQYHIELPKELHQSEPESHDWKKQYFHINELTAQWCHQLLLKSPAILRYLHDRGIDKTSASQFLLGYFPEGSATIQTFISYMAHNNILIDDLVRAHILYKGKTTLYSPFEQRIIFPIKNHVGYYCGFGGRVFKKEDTRAKYYNSQENEFFIKGALLYGLHQAKEAMQKANNVFLVEGYTDCIAMVQHGYKNCVASLGTACTLEHLKYLSRYTEELYVLYDSDAAGQQAILRIAELCWQVNLELKVVQLPQGEDPASFLKRNIHINQLIKEAKNIFHFFIESIGANFSSQPLNQKLQATRRIITIIGQIQDTIKQDLLLQEASKMLTLPYQILKDNLFTESIVQNNNVQLSPAKVIPGETINSSISIEPKLEKNILSAILNDVSLLNNNNREYIYSLLPSSYKTILTRLEELTREGSYDVSTLCERLHDKEKIIAHEVLFSSEGNIDQASFEYLMAQLQKKHWKSIVNDMKDKLELARNMDDNQKAIELLQEFGLLKQKLFEKNNRQCKED